MKFHKALALAALVAGCATSAFAVTDYNAPPANDKQFASCITRSNKIYEGGNEASPIAGETKAVAFCKCMWNETPEDFKGDLGKFAETAKGKATNKICETHSNWGN